MFVPRLFANGRALFIYIRGQTERERERERDKRYPHSWTTMPRKEQRKSTGSCGERQTSFSSVRVSWQPRQFFVLFLPSRRGQNSFYLLFPPPSPSPSLRRTCTDVEVTASRLNFPRLWLGKLLDIFGGKKLERHWREKAKGPHLGSLCRIPREWEIQEREREREREEGTWWKDQRIFFYRSDRNFIYNPTRVNRLTKSDIDSTLELWKCGLINVVRGLKNNLIPLDITAPWKCIFSRLRNRDF